VGGQSRQISLISAYLLKSAAKSLSFAILPAMIVP
jgi:hypothetical protein